jgi:hypothetical protein
MDYISVINIFKVALKIVIVLSNNIGGGCDARRCITGQG